MTAIGDVSSKTIHELVGLKGRSAVVTGAARGLGKAIARRLAEAGASVMVGDIDCSGAQAAAEEISAGVPSRVISAGLDVAKAGSITEAADQAAETFGGIDIWVNNAGIFPRIDLLDMTEESWDEVLGVNLRGVLMGCREAARHMIASGRGGAIVNIASTAGLRGTGEGLSSYVGSKHGVVGITRQLALELAPHRIRVLGIAPSVIVTEGVRLSQEKSQASGSKSFSFPCPLGRLGVPDDIARVALFCASDLSIYMTGTTLPVDAGQLI
jgi:NAD(P)-dependent dehydrogenase (short-subunit alcohol dehydrogenase family)